MPKSKVPDHETNQLLKRLRKEGWTIRFTRKHVMVTVPGEEESLETSAIIAGTPGGGARSMRNTLAKLRRLKRRADEQSTTKGR